MRVVVDGSPLRDGRRDAGIGRYVDELSRALHDIPDVDVRLALPRIAQPESWVRRYLYAQPWVLGQALAHRADIVHGMASDPVLAWPLRRQVVTLHDVAPWTTHQAPRRTPTARYLGFQRRRFRRCGAVIAVSDTAAVEAEAVLAVSPHRVHVIPEGVGSQFRSDAAPSDATDRRKVGVSNGDYVLWVGSLRAHDPRKALDDLLEAIATLGGDAPTLVLAGRTGAEAERMKRNADERKVAIVVTGYVSDDVLAALYRGAAVVAIPSRHEGFGLPLLEALACGAPVVATNGGNLPSLAGDAAVIVPPGNVRQLSDGLRGVLTDRALQGRLREAGPRRAAPFTWQRAAELTADVYRRVLGTRS
jgi:glycosyltransferase involved in cell wall biosynthesis